MKATAQQSNSGMRIIPYTPKSFAVVGDTYHVKETLKAMGGAFSRWLKVDGVNVPGWCFSLKREVQVRKFLMETGEVSPAPTVDKAVKPKSTTKAKRKAAPSKKATAPGKSALDKLVAIAVAKELAKLQKATEPKVEPSCSKERISQALASEPISARHWAMQHVLANGLQPIEVSKGTGLFGRDRDGKIFGESERKSMFWLLRNGAPAIDTSLCEDCPEQFRNQVDADTLLSIATEFSGPGGKSRLVDECCELAHQDGEALVRSNDWFPY